MTPPDRRSQQRRAGMVIQSTLAEFPPAHLRAILADLPRAAGYRLIVKPLRYRTGPHLQGLCDYEARVITVQVPEPFRPFRQRIPYRAQRIKTQAARGDPFAFRWFYRDVLFRTKTEVIRFLYGHEYYHYYLHEVLGRKGSAETACDRFALERFRRRPNARAGTTAGPSGPARSILPNAKGRVASLAKMCVGG